MEERIRKIVRETEKDKSQESEGLREKGEIDRQLRLYLKIYLINETETSDRR